MPEREGELERMFVNEKNAPALAETGKLASACQPVDIWTRRHN